MQKKVITLSLLILSLLLAAPSAFAGKRGDFWNSDNCVDSKWKDASGNKMSFDDKFGTGTAAVTLLPRKNEKSQNPVSNKHVVQNVKM